MTNKYSKTIRYLLGWSSLNRIALFDMDVATTCRARIGKVKPKRNFIRYLVASERIVRDANGLKGNA